MVNNFPDSKMYFNEVVVETFSYLVHTHLDKDVRKSQGN